MEKDNFIAFKSLFLESTVKSDAFQDSLAFLISALQVIANQKSKIV